MTAFATAPRSSALGTYVELAVTDPAALDDAQRTLRRELDELDRSCSRFRDDSELARVNAAAGSPVPVGERLRDAVRVAVTAAQDTDGLVDPTLGVQLVAAGYDRDFALLPPDGPAVQPAPAAAATAPAWTRVRVDDPAGTVLVPPDSRLDLGATAKARGADRAAAMIAERLGVGTLVSLGGDVATAGAAPRRGWPVRAVAGRVSDPDPDPDARLGSAHGGGDGRVAETVLLSGGGVATSSPGARRWRRGGQLLHHVLDPRTGRPAESCWRAVTVAAPSSLVANTAATAGVVMGAAALGWLAGTGWPARLVADDGMVHRIGGWPEPGGWSL